MTGETIETVETGVTVTVATKVTVRTVETGVTVETQWRSQGGA